MSKECEGPCPVARGLARVGDAWSMLILRDAGFGLTRFDQFRSHLGIAPNILTRRLRALTEAGLLEKRRYSERPPRDEYVLTQAGRDFLPVLLVIGEWGRAHHGEGGTTYSVDAETGRRLEPVVVDKATGRPIGSFRIALAGPDGSGGDAGAAGED
ncbi:helix-turn-helix domain-containing protein [Sphingomonas sp. BIUV-7]|uniref:Helix-turn-helix domain-containing protein n=1 Tax=Sphingomonas natans TaxID=3063330 RepID=A0ABT8YBF8_9SPHN|nr:helix-turn-helix domain-containing protein [Sphingomonas sp. BIUV-7]MDO6415673.1 helix-turn-helix domain-containing protein [Sphingomonas sp. BIUV-7]